MKDKLGKRLSDLDGEAMDTRTGGAAGLSKEALDTKHFLAHLEDLIGDDTLQWASSTLNGIHDSVQQSGKVTEGQRRAVANIRKHQGDDTRRRPTRRYEGW